MKEKIEIMTGVFRGRAFLAILFIALCSIIIFGQDDSNVTTANPNTKTADSTTKQTEKTTRERKATDSNPSSTMPQPNTLPTVDYLKEAQKYQKQLDAKIKKQTDDAQRQIEETRRQSDAERERLYENLNQASEQQNNRLNNAAEEQQENWREFDRQKKNAEAVAAAQWKWIWLIPLFEILQTFGLAFIAFKYKVAKKSAVFMIAGLTAVLFVILLVSALNGGVMQTSGIQSPLLRLFAAAVGIAGIYTFAVSKLSAYIIVGLMPDSLTKKLLALFGIGTSLLVLYLLIGSLAGYGLVGAIFGAAVIFIGGVIALVKGTKGNLDDLHGSARFADKKDLKEFEKEAEAGVFILAPADPKGNHGQISLPRSLSVMHGLILGGSGTGKSRGYFMPNCAQVKDTSLVVTDPKSELWKLTSGFHDKALRFAPTEPDASQCFNWISLCTDARMAELCARALMTAGSTHNTDQFWIDSETAFLSAIFAHTATTRYPTPLTAYRLFTRQKPEELMKQLLHSPSYVAREQAVVFEQTDARIKGAIVPAIASRLQFMRDPNIQLFTSASLEAPNFGQLRRTPMAIY